MCYVYVYVCVERRRVCPTYRCSPASKKPEGQIRPLYRRLRLRLLATSTDTDPHRKDARQTLKDVQEDNGNLHVGLQVQGAVPGPRRQRVRKADQRAEDGRRPEAPRGHPRRARQDECVAVG